MANVKTIVYQMKIRKALKNQPLELLHLTLKEVREEINRRNSKEGIKNIKIKRKKNKK